MKKTKEGKKTDLQQVEYPTKAGVRFDVNELKFIYNMRSYIIHQLYKLEKLNQGLDIVGTAISNDYGRICNTLEKTGIFDKEKNDMYKCTEYISNFTLERLESIMLELIAKDKKTKQVTTDLYPVNSLYQYLMLPSTKGEFMQILKPIYHYYML